MLLTKKEAADLLRVCPTTIRRMMKRGDLEGFRVGKITRITRKSLERLIGQPLDVPVPGQAHSPEHLQNTSRG